MASFGVDVTNMSPVDTRGFSTPLQGVEDLSGATKIAGNTSLIKQAGETVKDAYKGYHLGQLEKEINPIIDEYMQRRNPSTIFSDLVKENISPTMEQFQEATNKFLNAYKQDKMSSREFDIQVTNTLKQAVNKNPSMLEELSNHAKEILEISGIRSTIKYDEEMSKDLAKAQDDELKYYMGIAKENDIPLPRNSDGTIDMPTLIQSTAIVQKEKAVVTGYERKDKITENDVRSFGNVFAVGKLNQATSLAIQTLNDPSIPYEKGITNTNFLLDSVEQELMADPKIGRIADKPAVQEMFKFVKGQVASIKSNLKGYASREEAATYLKNTVAMLRDNETLSVMKTVNLTALDTMSKMLALPAVQALVTTERPDLKVNILDGIKNLLSGLPTTDKEMYNKLTTNKPAMGSQIVESLAVGAGKEEGEKDTIALSNTISAINTDISKLNVQEAFNFYSDYIKTLGKPSVKAGLKKIDSTSISKALENVNDYTTITLKDMKDYTANKGVEFDVLEDGRLFIKTPNPTFTNELNKKYIIRVNDALSAFANLHGFNSTKEAAPKFYSTYRDFFQ